MNKTISTAPRERFPCASPIKGTYYELVSTPNLVRSSEKLSLTEEEDPRSPRTTTTLRLIVPGHGVFYASHWMINRSATGEMDVVTLKAGIWDPVPRPGSVKDQPVELSLDGQCIFGAVLRTFHPAKWEFCHPRYSIGGQYYIPYLQPIFPGEYLETDAAGNTDPRVTRNYLIFTIVSCDSTNVHTLSVQVALRFQKIIDTLRREYRPLDYSTFEELEGGLKGHMTRYRAERIMQGDFLAPSDPFGWQHNLVKHAVDLMTELCWDSTMSSGGAVWDEKMIKWKDWD